MAEGSWANQNDSSSADLGRPSKPECQHWGRITFRHDARRAHCNDQPSLDPQHAVDGSATMRPTSQLTTTCQLPGPIPRVRSPGEGTGSKSPEKTSTADQLTARYVILF